MNGGRPAGKRVMARINRLGDLYDMTFDDCQQNARDLGYPIDSGNYWRETLRQLESQVDAGQAHGRATDWH